MKYVRPALYLLVALLAAAPVFAESTNNTFIPLTNLPGISDFATSNSLPSLLNNIYKMCIGIAAVLAVLQIMRAGVIYMGGDSITEKKQAKDLIAMSLVGLLLVLSPVIVFSIINPRILHLDIGAGTLQSGIGTGGETVSTGSPYQAAQGDGTCQVDCASGMTCSHGSCVRVTEGSCTPIANNTVVTTAHDQNCCSQQAGFTLQMAAGPQGGLPVTKCVHQ